MKPFYCFIRLIILVAFVNTEIIAQNINTDRPDQTESSYTVGNGDFQIETGFLVGFEDSGIAETRQIAAPSNLLRYGIMEGLELRFVSQYEFLKRENLKLDGISDLQIGVKLAILNDKTKSTAVALMSHVVAPSGSEGLSNEKTGTINRILVSHDFNETLSLGYNLGYDTYGNGDGAYAYTVALGKGVNDKTGVYIEPFGFYSNEEDLKASFDAGITYLLNSNTQLDFSFGTGINHSMNYMAIGISWLARKI